MQDKTIYGHTKRYDIIRQDTTRKHMKRQGHARQDRPI